MVNNLQNLVLGYITVPDNQCIRIRRPVMLHNHLFILLPELLLLGDLSADIVINCVEFSFAALHFNQRKVILDPHVAAVSPFQPVHQFTLARPAFNEFR